jgi:TolB-like protein/lipoprotein NlpI
MPSPPLLQRHKERKLVQWALAYLAGAWVVYEVTATVGASWGLSDTVLQGLFVFLAIGFFVTLVLAWYHGEMGRQKVSGPELLMVTALFLVAGGVLLMLGREPGAIRSPGEEIESVAEALIRMPGIAVLPFENRSGSADDRYFADGIHDDLLTNLQRAAGLRVISRTSSDAYRDTNKTIREIGQELGVDYILEGAVQRAGDRVRINVQLIDALKDTHLWGETYDRILRPDSLLDLQSEIVERVYGETGAALLEGERIWAARRTTMDREAFDLFARARELGDTEEATALLARAVERDPGFVAGHAALAMTHAQLFHYYGLRSEERQAAAREAAERAVELAPDSPDAQLAMGIYFYRVEKDFQEAFDWLGRAAGTLRGDYDYHLYRAFSERRMGRWEESIRSLEAVLALSPRTAAIWNELAFTLGYMRRWEAAHAALEEALRLDPGLNTTCVAEIIWGRDGILDGWHSFLQDHPNPFDSWWLAMTEGRHADALALLEDVPEVHIVQDNWYPKPLVRGMTLRARGEDAVGSFEEAVAVLEARLVEADWDERVHAALGLAYAGLGRRDDAVREAGRAVEILPMERDVLSAPWYYLNLASVHAQFGEVDEALGLLETILSVPSRYPPGKMQDHYLLIPLREESRFQEMIEREWDRVF